MSLPIIQTDSLTFVYDDESDKYPAVSNVSLKIEEGEFVAILGHNGSGKSTLAKLFNAVLTPTSGKVLIDGCDIASPDASEDDIFEARRKVGMVFQNADNQLVATIVEEDVAFGPENLGLESSEIRRRVDEALESVNMTRYARHSPHMLSGGQKQRIAIAGVIAMKPRCIIFDESTAMLDPRGRREVNDVMEKLNREDGITIVNITHYMEEAANASRIIVINDGELLMDGTPREIFARQEELAKIGLDVPQSSKLLHELKKRGCDIDENEFTPEGACNAILAALGK
jgi:energy-coupling factor transport system ATP-binding protein